MTIFFTLKKKCFGQVRHKLLASERESFNYEGRLELSWSLFAVGVEATRNVLGVLVENDIDANALRAGSVVLVDPLAHSFLLDNTGLQE